MELLYAAAVIGIATAAAFVLSYVYDRLLMPVRPGKGETLKLELHVSGDAPRLEATVRGLEYMRSSGKLPAELTVVDAGMSGEAMENARMLARRYGFQIKSR